MALLLKGGILYLHVPKTGGNWMTQVLADQGLVVARLSHKHATYDYACNPQASRDLVKTVRELFLHATRMRRVTRVVAVVRDPIAWYESWFKYQTARGWSDWGRHGAPGRWHVMAPLNGLGSPDFDAFMNTVNRTRPGFVSGLYERYLGASGGTALRNETLAADLVAVLAESGVSFDAARILGAGRIGVSPERPVVWQAGTLAETLRNERPALLRYGYPTERAAGV